MYNIHINFNKILEIVKDFIGDEVDEKSNNLRRCAKPKFSDIKLITLNLKVECLSIDSENYLFSKLNYKYLNDFENLISRRQYNDCRKLRFGKTVTLGKSMAAMLNK